MTLIPKTIGKMGQFVHSVLFGRTNLLLTNSVISALMGTVGDAIQQNYDLLINDSDKGSDIGSIEAKESKSIEKSIESNNRFNYIRSSHMTCAGFTTGLVSHYWYIYLDKFLGTKKSFFIVTKKVLLDQIIFSPISLFVYFSTLGLCERSGAKRVTEELIEKGFEQIYVVEWFIWPPMQYLNFFVIPLRYRIVFDNIISLGFDIYSPYVKYKTKLKSELEIDSKVIKE